MDSPWRQASLTVPAAAMKIPTMLCEDESRLLYWLTSEWAKGIGAVCDLGCFAGGSTARLAAGMSSAGNDSKIHAYDYFTISKEHKREFLYSKGVRKFWGENLLPTAKKLLKPWHDKIVYHKGDVATADWNGGPIEILFIDVMKSTDSADSIAKNFFPHLLAEQSVIVHQDYLHWKNPWITVQMQLLSDFFTPVAWAEQGSVVFSVDKVPEKDQIHAAQVSNLSDERMIELLQQAMHAAPGYFAKRQIARSILATQESPGCRTPWFYTKHQEDDPRIEDVLDLA